MMSRSSLGDKISPMGGIIEMGWVRVAMSEVLTIVSVLSARIKVTEVAVSSLSAPEIDEPDLVVSDINP